MPAQSSHVMVMREVVMETTDIALYIFIDRTNLWYSKPPGIIPVYATLPTYRPN